MNTIMTSEKLKDTEIGTLPNDWDVKTLKELNSDKKKNITPVKFPNEVFEYYSIPAYQDNQEPVLEKGKKILSQKVLLDKGTVLYGKLNPRVEKVWIVRSDSEHRKIGSTEWITVSPDENECDSEFVYYLQWSKFVMPLAKDMVSGSTPSRQRVKPTSYYQIKVPIPPLIEQKRIAHILSAIQSSILKTEHIINSYKELKRSMMKHLFTYGPMSLEEAEKTKLKETEIGMINKKWSISTIGKTFDVKQGKQLSAKESKEGKEKKHFLRTSNIMWEKVILDKVDQMYFTQEEFNKLLLKENDILVCEGGDIGRTALFLGEIENCTYQNHLHRLRPLNKESISNEFFVFWMHHAIINLGLYIYAANRTTIPNLSGSRLKAFAIPLPEKETQDEIANILSEITCKIEKETNKKKSLELFFKSMLQNLITAQVRVNELEVEI